MGRGANHAASSCENCDAFRNGAKLHGVCRLGRVS